MNALTLWILISIALALVAYDIFAVIKWGVKATISYNGYYFIQGNPIVGLALGIILGHILWPNCSACGG